MIRIFGYKRGSVKKIDLKKLNFLRELSWLDVSNPSENDLKLVSKKTGISLLDLEAALDKREIPRIFNRKAYSGIIFKSPNNNGALPFGIYIGKRFVLTIRKNHIKSLNKLSNEIQQAGNKFIFEKGVPGFVYYLLSEVIKDYSTIFDKTENKLDKLENKMLKMSNNQTINPIFSLKKELLYFRKSLGENNEVVSRIIENQASFIKQKDQTLFSNLHTEIGQLINLAELHRERITGITDIYVSNVSNKLNDIMKGFTVIASLLLLPTLLSGIWGMNFAKIPWYNYQYGFYYPIILMIISMILLFGFLKIKKWV